MKKTLLLFMFAALFSMMLPAKAQYTEPDTLWGLSDKFFTNFWPPRDWPYWYCGESGTGIGNVCDQYSPRDSSGHRILMQFHTDDTIRVIGIAITFWQEDVKPPITDSVLLYTADSTGRPVYRWAHPYDRFDGHEHIIRLPSPSRSGSSHYECYNVSNTSTVPMQYSTYYMENPINIIDTFYAGFTQYNYAFDDDYYHQEFHKWVGGYSTDINLIPCGWQIPTMLYGDSVDGHWYRCGNLNPRIYWVWPLIDVDYHPYVEDTTATDTTLVDTTGILGVQDREWVSVWPNPAQDRVVVEAESPIQQITVTNVQGQNIYDDRHRSAKVLLNCSWWPRGAYFVKFRTETDPALRVRKILIE